MRYLLSAILIFISAYLPAQKRYATATGTENIRSLQTRVEGRSDSQPVIRLNSDQQITVKFDELSNDKEWIFYRIIHCDSDWRESSISDNEYLDGFNNNQIEDIRPSFNTYINYYNYQVSIPNSDVGIRLSGNYAVEFYKNSEPDVAIATVCFSVYENLVDLNASVTSNTDIDFNRSHQQVSVIVNTKKLKITNPPSELKVSVTQNSRTDNEVTVTTPSRFNPDNIVYEHNRDLIFEAGNVYRKFEITSEKYPGIGVDRVRFYEPTVNAMLFTDKNRAKGDSYYFDRDQHGRFTIRNTDAHDNDSESDYYLVHFTLDYPYRLTDGGIYLNGEFTDNRFDESTIMEYDSDRQVYKKTLLLKQGHYNYQYLLKKDRMRKATPSLIEGNYYENQNEYMIKLYYRPQGARYDRIIGAVMLRSNE